MIFSDRDDTVLTVVQIVSLCLGVTVSFVIALVGCACCNLYITGKPRTSRGDSSIVNYNLDESPLSTDVSLELTSVSQRQSHPKTAFGYLKQEPSARSSREMGGGTPDPNDSFAIYSELDSPYSRLDDVNKCGSKLSPTLLGSGPMLPPRSPNRNSSSEARKSALDFSLNLDGASGGCINRESLHRDGEHATDPGYSAIKLPTDPGYSAIKLPTDPGYSAIKLPTDPGYSAIKLPPPRQSRISTIIDNDSPYSAIPGDDVIPRTHGEESKSRAPESTGDRGDTPKYAVVNKKRATEEDFSHLYSPIIKTNTQVTVAPLITATSDSESEVRSPPSGDRQDFGYASVKDLGLPELSEGGSRCGGEIQRTVTPNVYENPYDILRHDQ